MFNFLSVFEKESVYIFEQYSYGIKISEQNK